LPIYNKASFLKRSIESIQKQTLKNIEIIAINDYSIDNTLKILKKLSKKDNRIKIINNDRNHGLLYSRVMRILNSAGEYLMNLDPDDKYSNKRNLEILYNLAKIINKDLIVFGIKKIYQYSNINNKNKT
jgi:glycosyltransferase EpsH